MKNKPTPAPPRRGASPPTPAPPRRGASPPTPTPPQEGITKKQIITIQTILAQKGLREEKENIVTGVSAGRTCHVSELYFDEAGKLINFLASPPSPLLAERGDDRQKMQRHIIAMAHELGWIKEVDYVDPQGRLEKKKDYSGLHKWIEKYGYLHKKMNDYTYKELPTLVTQMRGVYASKLKIKK